tara:strand:+ start:1078 stop:1506 length:429 start_codon:yes stop_codon:yes gene_type:complete
MKKLFFLLITLYSCQFTYKPYEYQQKKSFISLQKKSCYGKCPIYEIEIFENGSLIFNGKKNIENIGVYNSKLTKEDMSKILDKAKHIEFHKLQNEYIESLNDLPKTILKVKNKVVEYNSEYPKELEILENLIYEISLKSINS